MFKSFMSWVLIVMISVMLIIGLMFATGEGTILYNHFLGAKVQSSQTEVFYQSKAYVDGMVQDLSRYKLELSREKDPVARQAIIAHINEQFANFDKRDIRDYGLLQFLNDVQNGNIQ